MANSPEKKKDHDWVSWAFIIFMLYVFWPLGLFLLLSKLFGKNGKQQKAPPLERPVEEKKSSAAPGKTRTAVKKAMKSPVAKKSNAKWLKIAGVILAVIGLVACWEPIDMMIWLGGIESYYVEELLTALAMAVGGGVMFFSGVSMDRSLKRYAKYLAVMGDREAVAVTEIARTLGYSVRRVTKDLEKMIDKGYFGGQAYLNVELGYLFRSGDADAAWRRQQTEAQAPKEAESGYAVILQNIRRANDAIADPVLSAKIDRLEEISARIFKAVEEDPKKQSKIDTFLNYYLPTTQKLLDSYAQFEAAGVEGENLRQAKQRIEATMDSIVRGFEHQLDELYKTDALDIDSDIRVMETMLRRDTATVETDFGLGTAAVRQTEEE